MPVRFAVPSRCRLTPRYLPSLLSCLLFPALLPTHAQDAPASAASSPVAQPSVKNKADASAVTLGEVVVTANRRREPSREVPMHVDTVSAQSLQQVGAKTMADYVAYQPGVFYASQGGPGQGTLIMRGVSTGNQTSPTTSVYIDDVPVGGTTVYAASATFVFDPALMDLDHVEFLYGPQGTLYGAGSMGGLVKYVTKQPDTSEFFGDAGLDLSSTQGANGINYTEHATVNLPLKKDVAALRISVFDQHVAGLYKGVADKQPAYTDPTSGVVTPVSATPVDGADRNHTRGARVQLEVDPIDKLTLNLTAMVQQNAADGLSMADYSASTGRPVSGGVYNRTLNHREPFTQNLALYSFKAAYDFGWANLDWISSYQDYTNHSVQDYPSQFIPLFNAFRGFLTQPGLPEPEPMSSLYVDSHYTVHKTAQEIRLTSAKGEHFDWLAGVWFDRENLWENYRLKGATIPGPGTQSILNQVTNAGFSEYAGYGDVTWHISPQWDLAAGVRASGNTQHLSNFEDGAVAGSPGGFREHMVSDDITKMLTLSYRPDSQHSYYMRAATGYRPGGLQAPVTSTITGGGTTVQRTFGSDTLQSYELGYKGSHLDGHLSLGADAYDIEWHNMQLITYTLGNQVVQNAGDARIDGLELQSAYTDGPWQFNGNAAYINARTMQANPAQGIRDGAALPYSARRAATLGGRYAFHLAGNDAYAGATWRVTSKRNAGFNGDTNDPGFKLPGNGILDLDAGVTLHDGTSIGLYLRNALNRQVPVGVLNDEAISFLASFNGPMLVQLSTPRTVGVSLNVPFR